MNTKLADLKDSSHRGSTGKLTFLTSANPIKEIRGLEVLNIHTNQIEKIYAIV